MPERRLLISVLVAHWCESISLSISTYFPNLHTYITVLSAHRSIFFRKTADYLASVTSDRTAQRFDRAVGSTREHCSAGTAQGYQYISQEVATKAIYEVLTPLILRSEYHHTRCRANLFARARQNGACAESIGTGPEFINMSYQQPSCLLLQLACKESIDTAECRRSTSSLFHRPRDCPLYRSQW